MTLDALNTFGTLITVVIVGATAIAALVQLRHLRAGNQITALLAVQNELDSEEFREAEVIIRSELPRALAERAYCEYEIGVTLSTPEMPQNDRYLKIRQACNFVGNTFENLGALVKNGILDRRLFLDIYSWIVLRHWNALEGLTAIARAVTGERAIFENFEYIAAISRTFIETHPDTYPPGMARLEVRLPKAAEGLLVLESPATTR